MFLANHREPVNGDTGIAKVGIFYWWVGFAVG
jgi:hypothetical protein